MLGAAMAQEEFASTFWVNGTMLSGYLKHPNMLSDKAALKLAKMWRSRYAGAGNAWKTPVLEEGMEWQSAGMPLADAQFVEQAKMTDLRTAQLFRIPPYMLGAEIGSSLTYSTTESQGIDFVRWTLTRWLRRMEKATGTDVEIFPPSLSLYPEFLVDGLLRAETKARYETYEIGIRSRVLLPNEARKAENRPPLDGGDEFPEIPAPTRIAQA
jgi:HK97 family phage portal protein